jgi:hypothetical protein
MREIVNGVFYVMRAAARGVRYERPALGERSARKSGQIGRISTRPRPEADIRRRIRRRTSEAIARLIPPRGGMLVAVPP